MADTDDMNVVPEASTVDLNAPGPSLGGKCLIYVIYTLHSGHIVIQT